jgi:hypothetical protein
VRVVRVEYLLDNVLPLGIDGGSSSHEVARVADDDDPGVNTYVPDQSLARHPPEPIPLASELGYKRHSRAEPPASQSHGRVPNRVPNSEDGGWRLALWSDLVPNWPFVSLLRPVGFGAGRR